MSLTDTKSSKSTAGWYCRGAAFFSAQAKQDKAFLYWRQLFLTTIIFFDAGEIRNGMNCLRTRNATSPNKFPQGKLAVHQLAAWNYSVQ
jgi:hypothetical protein